MALSKGGSSERSIYTVTFKGLEICGKGRDGDICAGAPQRCGPEADDGSLATIKDEKHIGD